ncbi:hypothetical protein ANO11243_018950 [Dothideomycetidae sp. 11243]|nr:hypothetical protein ANO11243_018950 [fungal sp. No.11243]
MSKFYRTAYPFPSQSYSSSDDEDEDDLPYPAPLVRSAFLEPDFSPAKYLATLGNRHQTLEDLRGELRDRVKELGRELVDVVNGEYEDLMGVGLALRGGDEKVQGVKVGLLGFRREVEGLRDAVGRRRGEVQSALGERRKVRGAVVLGRKLLDVEDRLGQLERRLGVVKLDEDDVDGDEEEDDEDEDAEGDASRRVRSTAALYAQLKTLVEGVGSHPFMDAQAGRIKVVRDALLLDLGVALQSARADKGSQGQTILLKLIASYRDIGEAAKAVIALKSR